MPEATEAPAAAAGAAEPVLPVASAPAAPEPEAEPEVVEAEEPKAEYVREEPKTVNHGVVQDNVSEPGVQKTIQADGTTSSHKTHTGAVEAEAEAEVDDEAE